MDNLTGCWDGFYTYARRAYAVGFGATLIETPGWLTGSTQEICTSGPEEGALLCATLEGHRTGSAVAFVKTYDGSAKNFNQPVHYEGTVNPDSTEIEGTWQIAQRWTGRFLMIRSGSQGTEQRVAEFEAAK
jgi:hypothetical protein